MDDDDLDKIAARTGGGRDHAARVARHVLDRAGGSVGRPLAYVLRAVAEDPAAHRYRPPNTAANQCPTTPGWPAGNCGGCRADALAGDA